MNGSEPRGIIDPSVLRLREATVTAGVWLTYVLCATGGIYVVLTWSRPNRTLLAALFGLAALCGAAVARLPRARIVRSRLREVFFLGWSILDLVLIAGVTLADGGTASPLSLIFFVPVVFAATTYPLASVATVGGLTVCAYLALAIGVGGSSASEQTLFTVVLACAGAMSAWQARNHDRQHSALAESSRSDPLTGCLNRRGFEERAAAEIAVAMRRYRQGAVLVLDVDHFKLVNDQHGHAAGDELLCWVVLTLQRCLRPNDAVGRLGGDEFAVLLPEIEPAAAFLSAARIARALSARAPASIGVAAFPIDGTELEELMRRADMRLYESRRGRPQGSSSGMTERLSWATAMAEAIDMRMDSRHEHSRAVGDWAVAIAQRLGWEQEGLGLLRIAAMLHDVGKIAVPDHILRKPGPLERMELEAMMQHSHTGAELVSRIEGLDRIVPWIRHSHESFDGSGYPDGLIGEAIPLASRILLVADAFDAITSTRPYRQARSVADAREELMRHAGRQFDPACVRALLEHLEGLEESEGSGAGTGADLRAADAAMASPRLAP
ncbi:MAG: diguanylate cyclase [Actinobacteria bacterium]|nr:MAG: diguanylate cyclase [Actinomycetota bacterium]